MDPSACMHWFAKWVGYKDQQANTDIKVENEVLITKHGIWRNKHHRKKRTRRTFI